MKKILALFSLLALAPLPVFASVDITLFGANPLTVHQNSLYEEPGYSAFSSADGDVTTSVVVSNPGTAQVGTFLIDYSVTDSTPTTATVSRGLVVKSAEGTMPYCSGPLAPGWQVGIEGGGCGGTEIVLQAGQSVMRNGVLHECPLWYGRIGCVIK